jgi:hypothetical protein
VFWHLWFSKHYSSIVIIKTHFPYSAYASICYNSERDRRPKLFARQDIAAEKRKKWGRVFDKSWYSRQLSRLLV